ncbi:hypothetical protein OAB94_02095 [Flavobacteriaceae bacterium]|nr:hypothetical protein [Flavobacteriaceae bacterium]
MQRTPIDNVYINTVRNPNGSWSRGCSDGGEDIYAEHVPQNGYYRDNDNSSFTTHNHYGHMGDEIPEGEMLDDERHLEKEDLFGVHKITIEASINGSLNELNKFPKKSEFTLSSSVLAQMKTNSRRSNRINAKESDLSGDVTKTVILDAQLVSTCNHYNVPIGMKCSIIAPKHLTATDSYVGVMKPGVTFDNQNSSVFSPNNLFTKKMYESYGKCDIDSLNDQIRFSDKNNMTADVNTNGIVWETIMENIDTQPQWQGCADDLYSYDMRKRQGELLSPWITIPMRVAEDVHTQIGAQLKNIEKSFVDMNTFTISFHRADQSTAWNDIRGLVGQNLAQSKETQTNHKVVALNKNGYASATYVLSYITYE